MKRIQESDAPRLSPELVGLIVSLGTAMGAAIATPGESREAVIVFVMVNALFSTLAFSVGRGMADFFRERSGGGGWRT